MTKTYKLARPSAADMCRWAARLRGLPPDRAKSERLHAARAALPADWRTRDKLTQPEWPGLDDLDLWRSLGRRDALLMLAPRVNATDASPYALAYCAGYVPTMGAYMMPETAKPTSPVHAVAQRHEVSEYDFAQYILTGDVSALSTEGRARFLVGLAKHVKIDPIERPFMLMKDGKTHVQGNRVDKWVVYATAACSSALCRIHGLSTVIEYVREEAIAGISLLMAKATCTMESTGRHNDAVGAVAIDQPETEWRNENGKNFKVVTGWRPPTPDEAANLIMKVSTKADRRAVLRCVGLGGIMDESELETVDVANNGLHFSVEPEVELEPEPPNDETTPDDPTAEEAP